MQTLPNVKEDQNTKALARLGQINFINSLPVTVPMLRHCDEIKARIIFGTPSELNKQYAQNKLDLGAMSSFFYLESSDMQLLPELSISSIGAVGSVLFFSKKDPKKLDKCKIAVPMSSATSINLLRVLLLEQFGVEPVLVTAAAPDLDRSNLDGALVIGDRALLVDPDWTSKFQRWDMGAWWHETCNLPMTFGVWAAKVGWVEKNPETFSDICAALVRARQEGLTTALEQVIAESMERLPLSHDRLHQYFTEELNFEFTPAHKEGLELYRSLCQKHHLFSSNPS
ncbi:MAG TPA: menaquinone biosynthesis protein [Drouetiella sp.]|jgi:chorismate dehydratase